MTEAFIPKHLLKLAEYIHNKNFSRNKYDLECVYRTVVNRSYYATYLHAREWVFNNGPTNNLDYYTNGNAGYHKAVIIALNHLKQYRASSKLKDFKDLREKADYHVTDIVSFQDAERTINLANDIINLLH